MGNGWRQKFAFKIVCKLLQIEAWLGLLLTDYRNLSSPYLTVLSPTVYDVLFSHSAARLE